MGTGQVPLAEAGEAEIALYPTVLGAFDAESSADCVGTSAVRNGLMG